MSSCKVLKSMARCLAGFTGYRIDMTQQQQAPTGCHLSLQVIDFSAKFLNAKILLQNYYSEKSAHLGPMTSRLRRKAIMHS